MKPRQVSFVLALVGFLTALPSIAPPASGQSPRLDEFVISDRSRYPPHLSADENGFVVVWQQFSSQELRVFAQRYSNTGELTSGTVEVTSGHERESIATASEPSGSFLVVWQNEDLIARRFSSTGEPLTEELALNTSTPSLVSKPRLANGPEGSFVAVWQGDDGDSDGIKSRRFDPAGAPATDELQINAYTTGSQSQPTVASFDDGSFLVVWQSFGQASDGFDIYAQRLSSTGAPLYDIQRLNDPTDTIQFAPEPEVSIDAEGNALVIWNGAARRLSATGELLGDEIPVPAFNWDSAGDEHGNFVVVWGQGFFSYDARGGHFGQHFSSTGERAGGQFRISPTVRLVDRGVGEVDIDRLSGSDFVVAYQRDSAYGSYSGPIYGRMLPESARAGIFQFAPLISNELPEPDADWATVESPSTVELTVLRSGGNLGEVTVDYFLDGGDAESGEDVLGVTGQLTFPDSELPWQTFEIEILDDSIVEGAEDLVLRLDSPTGGARLGDPPTTRLRIYDDDFNPPELVPVPRGEEIVVASAPEGRLLSPRLAASARGDLAVVWHRLLAGGESAGLHGRVYDPEGRPRGAEFPLSDGPTANRWSPAAAFGEDSDLWVVWVEEAPASGRQRLAGRRFSAAGFPQTSDLLLITCAQIPDSNCREIEAPPRLTRATDGRVHLVFNYVNNSFRFGVAHAFLHSDGTVEVTVVEPPGRNSGPVMGTDGDGGSVIAWRDSEQSLIVGRRFDRAFEPVGEAFQVSADGERASSPSLAMSDAGRFAVTWSSRPGRSSDARVLHFDADAVPNGESQRLPDFVFGEFNQTAIAADRAGNQLAVWVQQGALVVDPIHADGDGAGVFGRRFDPSAEPVGGEFRINSLTAGDQFSPDVAVGPHGQAVVIWVSRLGNFQNDEIRMQRFEPAPCATGAATLCLGDGITGRFHLEADWRDFEGRTGRGYATPLTDDTGTFWFFDRDNVEIVVKVLDGRGTNGHFWVFFGALSNVEFNLTVTDTVTGSQRQYHNPLGQFASVGDIEALPAGGVGRGSPAEIRPAPIVPAAKIGNCTPNGERLCLGDGRFELKMTWSDFAGNAGTGTALPLTGDTGGFWFFGPENVETVVKVLDGREINGHFWVFYGALSNVEFTLTVTDTLTGQERSYQNPLGEFASVGDILALPSP